MTEFEAELHQATGNDNKTLDPEALKQLARQTRIDQNLNITIKHLFAKYQEPKDKWRKSLKALIFTRYILEVGNIQFYKELKRKSFLIKSLYEKSKQHLYDDGQRSVLTSRQACQGSAQAVGGPASGIGAK
jgi:hypothetical protein